MNTNIEEKYDMIVIGSGIGGLAVASIMSKIYKKKVLIIEKHFKESYPKGVK